MAMKKVIKIENNKKEIIRLKNINQLINFYPDEAWVNSYGIKRIFNKTINIIYNDGLWGENTQPIITTFQNQEWVGPIFIVKISKNFHLYSLSKKEIEEYMNE